jgi:serine protease AprX
MKKYVVVLLTLMSLGTLQAANIPLKITPKSPKISARFERVLTSKTAGERTKIWVLFTDKGISDNVSLKAALSQVESNFSERSIRRRINRTKKAETFDFYDLPVYQGYIQRLESMGIEILRQSRWLNAVSIYADYEMANRIAALSFVAEIRPVLTATRPPVPENRDETPPETYKPGADLPVNWYGDSYTQLAMINVPLMHYLGYTGKGILIALFDTGFDLTHPVFDSLNLIADSAFIEQALIDDRHGTSTLSVIGGHADSILIGSAYEADYMVAATEVRSYENQTEEDNWVAAAEWADVMGADVISSSLGYFEWYTFADLNGNTALCTIAADLAASRGIAVFNSAGNERFSSFPHITPPADGDSVIAVGAVTSTGELASFSSPGPTYDGRIKPDIVALGVADYRANPGGSYSTGSGTSFSCPLSAGAGALLLQLHPEWSPEDLKEAMIHSGDRYDHPDNNYGYGLFDTFKAAALFEISPINPIRIALGDSLNLEISVTGQDTNTVSFVALNLPDSSEFTDNGDGTADLKYRAVPEDIGTREIKFIAHAGLMIAEESVSLTVLANADIVAGPNPFSDSLTIFIGPNSGRVKNISIYSVNGEKVWDKFSDSYNEGTGTIVWHGINNSGRNTAAGVYLILVETDKATEKLKVFKK